MKASIILGLFIISVSSHAYADSQITLTSCVPTVPTSELNFQLTLSSDELGIVDLLMDGVHIDRGVLSQEPPSEFFGSYFRLYVSPQGSELNVHSPNPVLPVGVRIPMDCQPDNLSS